MLNQPLRRSAFILTAAIAATLSAASHAAHAAPAQLSSQQRELFEETVRPLLANQCYRCHAADAGQNTPGLRLDTREGTRTALVPGKPDQSPLLQILRGNIDGLPDDHPTPDIDKATLEQIARWIRIGAPDPRGTENPVPKNENAESTDKHWAFQPLRDPAAPEIDTPVTPRSPIDRFVLARLDEKNLTPAPEADRRTLIRRLYFDLVGLPPSPDAIDRFVHSDDPEAYEKLVDRLLASPRFGERWGRHWLDVARYSDSSGGGRALLFPNAFRYRNYVINAFNSDKPFDTFIREQIAGDLMPAESLQQRRDQIVATGFLMLGPHNYEFQDKELLRMEVIDEQLDTMGRAMLGMTLGCARCHDHKFDPIPTEDYYALAGIFRSTDVLTPGNVSGWETRDLPIPGKRGEKIRQHKQQVAALQKKLNTAERRRERLESRVLSVAMDDADAELSGGWNQSSSVNRFVGESYSYTRGNGATATFNLEIPRTGRYQVRVSYAPHANRGTSVPVTIHHADGSKTIRIDQTQTPPLAGLYKPLGTFRFQKNKPPRIVIGTDGANGATIADAVRLVATSLDAPAGKGPRLAEELPGIVVDDANAKRIGNWKHSTFFPTYVGAGYIHDERKNKGKNAVVFTPDLPRTGTYELRLSYTPGNSRASAVPVTVQHAEGTTQLELNQQPKPPVNNLFKTVGRFRFEKGENASVRIDTTDTAGYVIVDAAQFIPVNERGDLVLNNDSGSTGPENNELADVERRLAAAEQQITDLRNQLDDLKANAPAPPPQAMAAKEQDETGDYHVCLRGDAHKLGPKVPRGYLSAITEQPADIPEGQSGRLQLARWLTHSEENPLTPRVFVNRVWHHLLGRGIVRTVDNFGTMGADPSHPELLDHLATRFVQSGWSVKSIIRHVVLSRTYRQSTRTTDRAARLDPDNRLFSHANRRRLQAECIRDAMLAIAGNLDLTTAGRAFPADLNSERNYSFTGKHRRSVYLPVFRYNIPDVFDVFDFANPSTVVGNRSVSTLPTQALYMMNSGFVMTQARHAAERLLNDPDALTDRQRLDKAYRLALGRTPTDAERRAAMAHLEHSLREVADAASLNDRRRRAWAGIIQSLFASLDFRNLE